jgi:uncharacterized protein
MTFADTVYWVAILNPRDQWHRRAMFASQALHGSILVTTEEVLVEVLAHYAGFGRRFREETVHYIEQLRVDPQILIEHQSHQSFLDGLSLYKARPDKAYSLTDCISMSLMARRKINEVLTVDHHFAQEGFNLLL